MPAAGVKPLPKKTPIHELISVVTEPTRWQILKALDRDTMSAAEIGDELGMKQANVQYHLKSLVKLGLCAELPLPDHRNRYVYRRRPFRGSISITKKGLQAEFTLVE